MYFMIMKLNMGFENFDFANTNFFLKYQIDLINTILK